MAIDQNILITVDTIVFSKGKERYLLLIQRKNDPFKGQWAFPGGFVEDDEDLPNAAAREVKEETGLILQADDLKQLGAWGNPGRDPRGRTVTIVYVAEINMDEQEIAADDDADDVQWWPLDNLPEIAFDHLDILRSSLERQKGM